MYDELVKSLRICSQPDVNCGECEIYKQDKKCGAGRFLMEEAADAIEELQQTAEHYKGCSDDWYKEACDYKAMLPIWWNADRSSPMHKSGHRFCPNCGAQMDMRGES